MACRENKAIQDKGKKKQMERNRKYHIDMIKIFAIFMVVFNHSGDMGFLAYQSSTNVLVQICQMIPAIVCKTAVPLFYMCTGALLLGKDESLKQLWKKRVVKYIFIMIGFTVLYYIFLSLRNQTPMDLGWILKTIYGSTTFSYSGAYWFLYSYVGFLIMLPLLRIIAKSLNKELVLYIIVINTFVRGILPIAEICLGMEALAVEMALITLDVFFYPFMGFYIEQCDFEEICKKKSLLRLAGMSIVTFLTSGFFTCFYLFSDAPTQKYLTLFGLYLVMFIFVLCKWICGKCSLSKHVLKGIAEIGNCTFGIYLIHGFIYTIIDDILLQRGISMTYEIAWIRCILVFMIGYVVIRLFKRIPGLKNIL